MNVRASGILLAVALVSAAAAARPDPDPSITDTVFVAALQGATAELLTEDVRASGAVACLQIDEGQGVRSVPEGSLRQFRQPADVRYGDECDVRPEGAIEAATGTPAFVLTAGPITWVSADEAHVSITYFRSSTESATRLYRVVRERAGWVCLGQIIKMAPALS
jgi:hypothetical protein